MEIYLLKDTVIMNKKTKRVYILGWVYKDQIETIDVYTKKKIGMIALSSLLCDWVKLVEEE